jgi:hypothetical protein
MAKKNSQDLVDSQGHRTLDRLQDKEGGAAHNPPQNPTIKDLERELFGATLDDISSVSEFDDLEAKPFRSPGRDPNSAGAVGSGSRRDRTAREESKPADQSKGQNRTAKKLAQLP